MSNADEPMAGRVIAGRFQIVRRLGAGGMGAVYEAVQDSIGRRVALKILSAELAREPKQVERFKREAQAASKLTDPHTIIVHDYGQDDDGTLFIAMEMLEGDPLSDVLKKDGALSLERAVQILAQVCDSLQEAHDAGLVHRDLKPENIFLTQRGDKKEFVKVLDFGIAKMTQSSDGEELERLTQAGAIFGTPYYMSPEQVKGVDVDSRSDVYALGVLLHRMLSGEEPFSGHSMMEVLTMHLTTPPPDFDRRPHQLPQAAFHGLVAVAKNGMVKEKEDRIQSARAFREAMYDVLDANGLNRVAGRASVSQRTLVEPNARTADIDDANPRQSGSKMGLIGGVVAILALAAGGFMFMGADDKTPPGAVSDQALGSQPQAPNKRAAQPDSDREAMATKATTKKIVDTGLGQQKSNDKSPLAQSASPEKAAAEKAAAEKAAAEKAAAEKAAAEKAAAEKAAAEKAAAEKAAAEKAAAEKAAAAKAAARTKKTAKKTAALAGQLSIFSSSSGLSIRINGKAYGRTPVRKHIQLKPGRYNVVLSDKKKGREQKKVIIKAGGVHRLSFQL